MSAHHPLFAVLFWAAGAAITGFVFALILDSTLFGSIDMLSAVRWAGIAAIIGTIWGVVVQQLHED